MTERPGSSAGRERASLPNRASTTVRSGGSVDGWAMARALSLAAGALGRTSPNPAVGAVIVDGSGIVVGEGATRAYGQAHAEPVALAMAGGARATQRSTSPWNRAAITGGPPRARMPWWPPG